MKFYENTLTVFKLQSGNDFVMDRQKTELSLTKFNGT